MWTYIEVLQMPRSSASGYFTPTVNDRVNISITNIVRYTEGNKETSMGLSFLTWKTSLTIFLSDPVFGIGTID
jgi:hypothetical protein